MAETLNAAALRRIVSGHEEQMGLCRTLEMIADSLPKEIDPAVCKATAGTIHKVMTRVVQTEQEALSHEVANGSPRRMLDPTATITRLLSENAEDLSYAEELQEILKGLSDGRRSVSTDALGYMLRGFFESRRRRIALEREILSAILVTEG